MPTAAPEWADSRYIFRRWFCLAQHFQTCLREGFYISRLAEIVAFSKLNLKRAEATPVLTHYRHIFGAQMHMCCAIDCSGRYRQHMYIAYAVGILVGLVI